MIKSSKARKQRKAIYNAHNVKRRKMISSHLSESLMKEYKRRSLPVIKGDTVLIVRGDEEIVGTEGKVVRVDTKTGRVIIEGVTINKADGSQAPRPIHASNVVITKLDLSDPWRKNKLIGVQEGSS
ncbi:MAG: 50S ribosomal protein L24 [Methanomassiliicoccales archaeon]|jgi:large subunit ribosomal protein L24|nr:50S ribosomal protein L24 [Methanomassiliicoccales archaeon]